MIALVGAIRRFHFAQQCIHFRRRQYAVRTNRMMAGHRGKYFMAGVFDHYQHPRYTSAESTLIKSTGNSSASFSANSVLPLPDGEDGDADE